MTSGKLLNLSLPQFPHFKDGDNYSTYFLGFCEIKCDDSHEYIMQNAGLDEAQAGIKIARRNINALRYADDTTLTAEREEELKSS